MDDATLVKVVAAQYVQGMGLGAIPYLREMQELSVSLSDADSAQAWRDIADAAHAILLALASDSSRPQTQPSLCAFVPCIRELERNTASDRSGAT
jgi:hypothetical protein